MQTPETHLVLGAFGYSGRYICAELLDRGHHVRTLTASPDRDHPFADRVEVHRLDFSDPQGLRAALEGVRVLYNTYWVRFSKAGFSQQEAVANTIKLFEAAVDAEVERVVHVSITNPSLDSPFEYFRGKAELERALVESGLSYSILRPAVLFGGEDILINNMAWMLRRFPLFGVFGDGNYRLQPIHVEDLAKLAVTEGESRRDIVVDAIGPETLTYRELVRLLGRAVGHPRPIVSVPPMLGLAAGWLMGLILRDVVITREEIGGLMADLLVTDSAPTGSTALSAWAETHGDRLGRRYSNELARRRDRSQHYERL